MAAGKNKLLRFARVIYGGYDLSGDARTFDSLDSSQAAIDMTGVGDDVANSLLDRRMAGVTGFQAYANDATAGAFTILRASEGGSNRLSILLGSLGEPVAGDPAYLLPSVQITNPVGFEGGAAVIGCDFAVDTAQYSNNVAQPWGVVLHNAALTVTADGTIINNGAATSNGAHANLHVTVSDGGTWAFLIEDSTNGAWAGEETTLMTFTANGSAITSEQQTASGTVKQYVRLAATRTSGTCTVIVTFARN